jgi:hypothetical protein
MFGILIALAVAGFLAYEILMGKPDTSNWPPAPSDAIFNLAVAIARAEGSGAVNNPGDLTAGDVPTSQITGTFNDAGVVNIDTLANGVNALYAKLQRIANGASSIYPLSLTIQQFANTYVNGSAEEETDASVGWAETVSGDLGISMDDQLSAAFSV